MVQFGATLLESRREDWKGNYIDYQALKAQLRQLKDAYNAASEAAHGGDDGRGDDPASSTASPIPSLCPPSAGKGTAAELGELSAGRSLKKRLTTYSLVVGEDVDKLEDMFSATLDDEVEKVVLFFLAKQGELARRLLGARREQEGWKTCGIPTVRGGTAMGMGEEWSSELSLSRYNCSPDRSLQSVYCAIGVEIAELMRFLQLNVSGVRKILKKHDKQIRDKLIATHYLSTRAQEKYSFMRQLYNNEGIMSLVASLRSAFEEFEDSESRHPSVTAIESPRSLESTALLEEGGERGLPSGRVESATGSHTGTKQTFRDIRAMRRRSLSNITMAGVLNTIAKAQKELAEAQHRTISQYLSLQVLLDGSGLSSLDEAGEISDDKRELHRPSAWINLGTTFLYMMNYYIVGPTSAEYAAALGGSPAASGLIIGMTPIAACFSCLLYSWWTNTSFRQPLLLCTGMLVAGNLLYGMALFSDAFWMVLLGRTLIGLGGARGVSRRYIADTIPIESRTAYSAAFVAVGSVGMALGPFLSAMMMEVDFTIVGVRFNGLTNPGWIMFVLWVVVGFLLCTVFQEPRRGYTTIASNQNIPEDTPEHARRSERSAAVWSTEAVAADAAGPCSINSSTNYKVNVGGGGVKYGSTGNGAALPTTAIDAEEISTAGEGAVLWWNNAGAEPKESAALLPRAAGESANVAPVAADTIVRSTSGEEGEVDDGSSGQGVDGGEEEPMSGCSLGAISRPLAACLFGYFVNKLVTEVAICSAPVLTQVMFDWSISHVGCMMSVLGLVVLPVNAAVGHLSQLYEDRALLQVLAVVAALGCLVAVDFSWLPYEYNEWQYMAGVGLAFVAMQAHEGVVMSITTKVIPAELARGTWNSGFLATEAGTFGRFVGDALITTMGVMTLSSLNLLLFLPSMILVGLMVLGFLRVYPFLQGE